MHFYKYQGTGNDFILIDDRSNAFNLTNTALVKQLCDRRFGIGADGLILLRLSAEADFEMIYFNSDGNLSSMCGNGGRCIARFAQRLGIIENQCTFKAVDGKHQASLSEKEVSLKMNDVTRIEDAGSFIYLNTGSPHVVKYMTNIDTMNVMEEGRKIRYNSRFYSEGTNVNFIDSQPECVRIRTYERGVEDETLSCGTGITASAIAEVYKNSRKEGSYAINLKSQGGDLKVTFDFDGVERFSEVHLIGPAEFVFEGEVQ